MVSQMENSPALWMAEPDGFEGIVKIQRAPTVCRPCLSGVCGCAVGTRCWVFVCLCSYWVICSDLIVTLLSSGLLAQEGRGRGGGSGEGMGLLSHTEEERAQPPCAWKPGCPGVPTPC